ncbi:hypothetical protein I79_019265 [Cricetulus griseus]|uniref:Secreted protein n=1 Tax=Cricetulus griseus TaxID=10029 RepID=G3I6Y5_CRIGR|nr:hypothetical protein I79_019265 [Cricetulus griseus]
MFLLPLKKMDRCLLGLLLTLLPSDGSISKASLLGQAWPGPSHLNLLLHFPMAGGNLEFCAFLKNKQTDEFILIVACVSRLLRQHWSISLKIRPV